MAKKEIKMHQKGKPNRLFIAARQSPGRGGKKG